MRQRGNKWSSCQLYIIPNLTDYNHQLVVRGPHLDRQTVLFWGSLFTALIFHYWTTAMFSPKWIKWIQLKQLLQVDLSVYHTCQNGILRFTYRNLPISWHPFLTEEILFIISQWIIQTFQLDVGTRIISIKVIKKKSVSLIPHKLSLRSQEWTQTFDSVIGITVVSL